MRVLITLENALPADEAASVIAEAAAGNEAVVVRAGALGGDGLELALRNELPEREVVSLLTRAVVGTGDDPAAAPLGVLDLPTLRLLLESGAVVICACEAPVAIGAGGRLREADSPPVLGPTAELLARRLGADLLVAR